MASTTSVRVIMPRSPCPASAGCMKKAGVPVLASVAAILPAIWPDLPMPVTTTLPLAGEADSAGRGEALIDAGSSASTARASMLRALRAELTS